MMPSALLLLTLLRLAPAASCAQAQGNADLSGFMARQVLPGVIVSGAEQRIDAPRDAIVALVHVREGQRVRRGERLLELTDAAAGDTLRVARAGSDGAAAGVRAAEAEAARLQGELERRQRQPALFAREQIEAYVAQLQIARAHLDAARAELSARLTGAAAAVNALRSLQVDAPADLRVRRVLAVVGKHVVAGSALLDLIDEDTATVRFATPLGESPAASLVGTTVCVLPSAGHDTTAMAMQVIERSHVPDAAGQIWINQGRFDAAPDWAQAGVAVDVIVPP